MKRLAEDKRKNQSQENQKRDCNTSGTLWGLGLRGVKASNPCIRRPARTVNNGLSLRLYSISESIYD
jgi:hypothetical protein